MREVLRTGRIISTELGSYIYKRLAKLTKPYRIRFSVTFQYILTPDWLYHNYILREILNTVSYIAKGLV
jgi:hypothetical protein